MKKTVLVLLTICVSLMSLLTYTVFESDDIVSQSIPTAFAMDTWIGLDCSILDEELIPMCNDVNVLNDRTVELEQLKLVDLIKTAPLTTNTDKIIISPHSSYTHTAECKNGGYIMNLGFAVDGEYIPPNPEMFFFIIESYQLDNSSWVFIFGNPTDDNINMKIVYSCLGKSDQSK